MSKTARRDQASMCAATQCDRRDVCATVEDNGTGERMHHAGLVVADLERSVIFYRDLLGLPLLDQGRESDPVYAEMLGVAAVAFRWAELDLGGGHVLELICYVPVAGHAGAGGTGGRACESPPADYGDGTVIPPAACDRLPPMRGHLALRVADAAAAFQALTESGTTVLSRPVCLQEENHWRGTQAFYAFDPDGHLLELLQEARPVRREEPATFG